MASFPRFGPGGGRLGGPLRATSIYPVKPSRRAVAAASLDDSVEVWSSGKGGPHSKRATRRDAHWFSEKIKNLARHDYMAAYGLLKDMHRHRQPPTTIHYNLIIQAASKRAQSTTSIAEACQHRNRAMGFYREMRKVGILPSSTTFVLLLKSCSASLAINDLSNRYLREIRTDVSNPATSVDAYFHRTYAQICKLWDEYTDRVAIGRNPESAPTQGLLNKHLHQVETFSEDSIQNMDIRVFNAFTHSLVFCGAIKRAFSELDSLGYSAGLEPDARTYSSMLTAMQIMGDVNGALRLYEHAMARELRHRDFRIVDSFLVGRLLTVGLITKFRPLPDPSDSQRGDPHTSLTLNPSLLDSSTIRPTEESTVAELTPDVMKSAQVSMINHFLQFCTNLDRSPEYLEEQRPSHKDLQTAAFIALATYRPDLAAAVMARIEQYLGAPSFSTLEVHRLYHDLKQTTVEPVDISFPDVFFPEHYLYPALAHLAALASFAWPNALPRDGNSFLGTHPNMAGLPSAFLSSDQQHDATASVLGPQLFRNIQNVDILDARRAHVHRWVLLAMLRAPDSANIACGWDAVANAMNGYRVIGDHSEALEFNQHLMAKLNAVREEWFRSNNDIESEIRAHLSQRVQSLLDPPPSYHRTLRAIKRDMRHSPYSPPRRRLDPDATPETTQELARRLAPCPMDVTLVQRIMADFMVRSFRRNADHLLRALRQERERIMLQEAARAREREKAASVGDTTAAARLTTPRRRLSIHLPEEEVPEAPRRFAYGRLSAPAVASVPSDQLDALRSYEEKYAQDMKAHSAWYQVYGEDQIAKAFVSRPTDEAAAASPQAKTPERPLVTPERPSTPPTRSPRVAALAAATGNITGPTAYSSSSPVTEQSKPASPAPDAQSTSRQKAPAFARPTVPDGSLPDGFRSK